MNYIVVGCGHIGAELAYNLFKKGHKVSVIDRSPSAFNNLPLDFRGRTVEGEGLEREVLYRAGIEHADGLVAVTSSDAVNAVVAHVAKVVYGIENVAVRNYEPRQRAILRPSTCSWSMLPVGARSASKSCCTMPICIPCSLRATARSRCMNSPCQPAAMIAPSVVSFPQKTASRCLSPGPVALFCPAGIHW